MTQSDALPLLVTIHAINRALVTKSVKDVDAVAKHYENHSDDFNMAPRIFEQIHAQAMAGAAYGDTRRAEMYLEQLLDHFDYQRVKASRDGRKHRLK